MSSNTESPSPTSSPSRPKPSRKATRSATPPIFKATLSRRSSLAAPVAATTAEHTYFTPSEPAATTTPAVLSDEPSNAPVASLQSDPAVSFPSEQISAPEQQPISDQNNQDDIMSRERSDSGASTSRRNTMFGNLARPLRRSGSISDSGASAPALASLLETQQRDQAARDAVKARTSTDVASDVGSGSEAESNPLAPRRKPKRQGTFSKMVGNLTNSVRRRKTSDGSIDAAAAATAAVASPPAPASASTEQVSQLAVPAQTSAPTSTIVSPIAETSEITSPIGQESNPIPTPVEAKAAEPAPEAPTDPAVDLSSPPASPTVEVPPFTIQPAAEIPTIPNIEESAVLVEPAQAEIEVASAVTKMTPVSSAAADSTFKQKQEESAEHHEAEEQDWEKVSDPQQVRPQASFVYTDDGSLADESASSFIEPNLKRGPSVVASMKDKIKSRAIDDEQASTKATMGDIADPSEQVPPTPFITAFAAKEAAPSESTLPITPDSDKFPELPRGKRVGASKLGETDEKSSFPGNYKESAPDDGTTVEGGLSDLLPSRETVDMAAQYAFFLACVWAIARYI